MSNSEISKNALDEIIEQVIEKTPKIENIEGYYSLLKETDARAACLEVAKAVVEECATIAHKSNFVDGPQGTVEGQITRAIRALVAGDRR